MASSKNPLPELTPAERGVMEVVWGRGPVSATAVRDALAAGGRELSRNTVRTLLERMGEKGWVTHEAGPKAAGGRAFLYSAARPREATVGQKVREVVDTVCGGSPEAMVAALLDYRGLKKGELDRIRAMLDEARPRRVRKDG